MNSVQGQRRWVCSLCWIILCLSCGSASLAEVWRSPLHDLQAVQIEKRSLSSDTAGLYQPISSDIIKFFDSQFVEYEAFIVGYLPVEHVSGLKALLERDGLIYHLGVD